MILDPIISALYFTQLQQYYSLINRTVNTFKPLTTSVKGLPGRSYGRIVSPRHSSFCKQLYRYIDFYRTIFPGERGLLLRKGYDPQRSTLISLICFPIGVFVNILCPSKILEGNIIQNQATNPKCYGDSSVLANIPSGSLMHNISLRPRGRGQLIRSAGCSTILVRQDISHSLLKLKSGELRYFSSSVTATLGTVGSETHFLRSYVKAGTMRRLGKRPRTRPSAMNPVDHPMGGRTKGGCQPMTAKGLMFTHRSTKKYYQPKILYTKRQLKFRRF